MSIEVLNTPMSSHIFVVAGNAKQYEILLNQSQEMFKDELKKKKVHFVAFPEELEGILPARVILYGTYFKRGDWNRIDQAITSGNHKRLLVR